MSGSSANEDMRDKGFAGSVVENSWVGTVVSGAESKGIGVVERVADVARESYLYRWLAAEPEPDVVVIDLRETYTVRPFIRLLDATVEWLYPCWEASTLKRVVDASVRALERFSETKTGRILASELAPLEPPEQRSTRKDEPGEDERPEGKK